MTDLRALESVNRLLVTVPLCPVQGDRFQPTGFPSLGAATYQTKSGQKLLVESAQSMANRLESTCWDGSRNAPVAVLEGVSHVTVMRKGEFLTDSSTRACAAAAYPKGWAAAAFGPESRHAVCPWALPAVSRPGGAPPGRRPEC